MCIFTGFLDLCLIFEVFGVRIGKLLDVLVIGEANDYISDGNRLLLFMWDFMLRLIVLG